LIYADEGRYVREKMGKSNGKLNCWEFKKCGRQPGGENVEKLGLCPAATEVRLDGVHNGNNAGRACWVVSGTLCGGEVQGTFAMKFKNCQECEFFQIVKEEEHPRFHFSASLLEKLKVED
jgi:hypothetical protein